MSSNVSYKSIVMGVTIEAPSAVSESIERPSAACESSALQNCISVVMEVDKRLETYAAEAEEDTTSESTADNVSIVESNECSTSEALSMLIDEEAMFLCEKIFVLETEYQMQRDNAEANAVLLEIEHAARQFLIPYALKIHLIALVAKDCVAQVCDVLYQKCHLIPYAPSFLSQHPLLSILRDSSLHCSFTEFIREAIVLDSENGKEHKSAVLRSLSALFTRWIKMLGHEKRLTEEQIAITCGALFLAGSYRLGLDDISSDIDVVCVAPGHVTCQDFFTGFYRILDEMDDVTYLFAVPNASVPVISLLFQGVALDLLFARLPLLRIEDDHCIDRDHVLYGIEPYCVKSLNAARTSSILPCLVPNRIIFRQVLRAIRLWARQRGIYSGKLGYLGGISWAILVAFVCQMYAEASETEIFVSFFRVFASWNWPQPVRLNVPYDSGVNLKCWNASCDAQDRSHVMPILTPSYPYVNSCANVNRHTFSILHDELVRARNILEDAVHCGNAGLECWKLLFEPSDILSRYEHYLVFTISAESAEDLYRREIFVASRLKHVVENLELLKPIRIQPFPQYFPCTSDTFGSSMYMGLVLGSFSEDLEFVSNLNRTIAFFLATHLGQDSRMRDRKRAHVQAKLLDLKALPEDILHYKGSEGSTLRAQRIV